MVKKRIRLSLAEKTTTNVLPDTLSQYGQICIHVRKCAFVVALANIFRLHFEMHNTYVWSLSFIYHFVVRFFHMQYVCSVYCVSNSSVHQKIDIEPLLNIYNSWYNELLELFVVALLPNPSHFFFLFFVSFIYRIFVLT